MNKMRFTGSAVFGIILIAVGVVSLLSGLNYFQSWDIFSTYWPLVIVLFGIKSLIDHRSSTIFGIILIAIGAFLQIDNLGLWYLGDINMRELIIPMIIILIGLNFVLPRGKRQQEDDIITPRKNADVSPVRKTESKPVADVESKEVAEVKTETAKAEQVQEVIDPVKVNEAPQEQSDAPLVEEAEKNVEA